MLRHAHLRHGCNGNAKYLATSNNANVCVIRWSVTIRTQRAPTHFSQRLFTQIGLSSTCGSASRKPTEKACATTSPNPTPMCFRNNLEQAIRAANSNRKRSRNRRNCRGKNTVLEPTGTALKPTAPFLDPTSAFWSPQALFWCPQTS